MARLPNNPKRTESEVTLVAGPTSRKTRAATNVTSLSVLFGLLGKRATAIYLVMLSLFAVLSGLALDSIYNGFGVSASAIAGQAGEVIPYWLQLSGTLLVILLSVKPLYLFLKRFFSFFNIVKRKSSEEVGAAGAPPADNTKNECRAPS